MDLWDGQWYWRAQIRRGVPKKGEGFMSLINGATTTWASLAGGAVDVDFDKSAFIQAALFLVLLFVIKPILLDPMIKLFEERERRIDGAKLEARHMDQESAGALAKFEKEMAAVRSSANTERDKVRAEALKAEGDLLAKVRERTAAKLEQGRKVAADEAKKARQGLDAESRELARALASRALGREVHE
jgi:F-type H+-transporting ATPase subunit b